MTSWMIWSAVTSALVATAAAALDRVASMVAIPRRFVWMSGIAAAVVAPIVLGRQPAPLEPAPSSIAAAVTVDLQPLKRHPLSSGAITPPSVASTISIRSGLDRSQAKFAVWLASTGRADDACITAWIVASIGLLALFMATVFRLHLQQKRWPTADTEIGPVYMAPDVGPAVIGFLRQRIVVPHWALAMEGRARSLLLRHELEHVHAGDARTIIAAEVLIAALPWNVPLWWMVHRLRLAVEMDCDARVLKGSNDAYAYGSMLLSVGERHARELTLAASLLDPPSALEVRIIAIAAPRHRRPIVGALPPLSAAALALSAIAWTPIPRPALRSPELAASSQHPVSNAKAAERQVSLSRDTLRTESGREAPVAVATADSVNAATVVSRVPPSQERDPIPDTSGTPPIQSNDSVLTAVGYFERKKSGIGFFIGGAMIDRQSRWITDILRTIPGLRISPRPDNRGYLVEDANVQPHGCVITFVDGIMWATPSNDLDQYLQPTELLGVERYRRAEAPRQFAAIDGSECTTLVVWTRALEKRRSTRGE